ncbi:MAG: transglutaminase domain-containing protein [Microgenomates group bacterium]
MSPNRIVRLFAYLSICLCAYLVVPAVHAADFKTSYAIDYFIREDDPQNYTKTAYTIKLTNLQPDLIIKKYTLSFPKSFGIGNMSAKDDKGTIIPLITEKERSIEVSFELNSPVAGLNEVNTLYLDFLQKNIFRSKGTIWEVFIPTIENKADDVYAIAVYLPPGKHKKLSLAKPSPDVVSFDKVVWNRNVGKSIYAVFGETQNYSIDLTYHLTNPNIYRVYTDISFPPDTLYQQIVVSSISPKPDSVFTDTDGNFMGRYTLNPKEEKTVVFKGAARVSTQPRSEYKAYAKNQFESQQKTLFNAHRYWKLDNETPIQSSSIYDHYDYTVKTLAYNFNRVITGNSRMGASEALRFPDQAVCTEYSDLLIASARQRGLFVREIQGFAFANEQELRPVQQDTSDILHSWVEYYDTKKDIWIPVDPTWEDTSGIDYFNSFDFNHIVFAIHGKKADYPFPAGSYRSTFEGKDVRVEPVATTAEIVTSLSGDLSSVALPQQSDAFGVELVIRNSGNISQWDIPLTINIKNASLQKKSLNVVHLFPGEEKKEMIVFTPKGSLLSQDVTIEVLQNGKILAAKIIKVPTIVTTVKNNLFPLVLIGVGIIIIIFLVIKKNDND